MNCMGRDPPTLERYTWPKLLEISWIFRFGECPELWWRKRESVGFDAFMDRGRYLKYAFNKSQHLLNIALFSLRKLLCIHYSLHHCTPLFSSYTLGSFDFFSFNYIVYMYKCYVTTLSKQWQKRTGPVEMRFPLLPVLSCLPPSPTVPPSLWCHSFPFLSCVLRCLWSFSFLSSLIYVFPVSWLWFCWPLTLCM